MNSVLKLEKMLLTVHRMIIVVDNRLDSKILFDFRHQWKPLLAILNFSQLDSQYLQAAPTLLWNTLKVSIFTPTVEPLIFDPNWTGPTPKKWDNQRSKKPCLQKVQHLY